MDKFLGFKTDEILTCLLLIVVGYVIAKMFNGCGCSNNGFSVGIQRRSDGNNCVDGETCNAGGDTQYRYPCPSGGKCYNLVIDDGNVDNCRNPEGVSGNSNDTYCIQDKGLPPGDQCNNNNDCQSGDCSMGVCMGVCSNNPLKLFPDCDTCRNPKFGGPNCGECANKKYSIESNCDKCRNPKFGGLNCGECENDLADINTNCTTCKNDTLNFMYSLPDCTARKPCNELTSMKCSLNGDICKLDDNSGKCVPKI